MWTSIRRFVSTTLLRLSPPSPPLRRAFTLSLEGRHVWKGWHRSATVEAHNHHPCLCAPLQQQLDHGCTGDHHRLRTFPAFPPPLPLLAKVSLLPTLLLCSFALLTLLRLFPLPMLPFFLHHITHSRLLSGLSQAAASDAVLVRFPRPLILRIMMVYCVY